MTSSSGLTPRRLIDARDRFLRKIDAVPGSPGARGEATQRLTRRLATWHGAETAGTSRFKGKVARGVLVDCVAGYDEAELIIARAIAITNGEAQFTVSPDGTTYATENNGHTREFIRVPVGGLSPLIDDASYILNQIRDRAGGRMFFTRASKFLDARSRRTFLTVISDTSVMEVRDNASEPGCDSATAAVCPTCFQLLPLSGVCGTCR